MIYTGIVYPWEIDKMPTSSPVRLVGCDDPGPSDPVRIVNISDISAGMAHGGEITVATSGGDYTTIKEALQNASARDVIQVYPGIYQEDNPLPGVANVALVAVGSLVNTRIEALNANQDLFTSADAFNIRGFALADVSGTGWVVDVTADHSMLFENCAIFQCEQGVRVNNANADVGLSECLMLSTAGVTLTAGVQNNAGNLTIAGMRVLEGASITTLFNFDGANAISTVYDLTTFESGVSIVLQADNSARSVFNSSSMVGMVDGAVLQGGSDTRFVATSIFLAQQDSIRIPNVGSGTNLGGQGLTIEDSTRYDLNILSASATVSGYGQASLDQMNITDGAQFTANFIDLKEDDEGLNVIGELHVGMPEAPTESVFGGGDSYTRGMLVYTFNPAGSVWTDVSAAARSASGSTFTFPAVAVNNAIYVASSLCCIGGDFLQHFGIKLSQTVATVLGGGAIVIEYWDGGSWTAINHMSTLSNSPWTQYAKALFERTGSEQLRYEEAFLSGWTKNDPMTLGTDYFWIRFRISSGITTAPTFQQFKLHTNRTEINADGVVEFFGAARPERELVAHIQIATAVVGSAPANASVDFTATTTLSLTRNQFNDNQVHSYGQIITIPTGLDTSLPVTVEAVWYPDTNNAGNVELEIIPGQLSVGDLFDGSVADGTTLSDINAVAANSQYESRKSTFELDVTDLVPGDFLVVRVERDATAGNADDTLAGNIVNAEFRAFGRAWRA